LAWAIVELAINNRCRQYLSINSRCRTLTFKTCDTPHFLNFNLWFMLMIYMVFVIKANTRNRNPYQILNQLSAVIEALDGNANFPITNPTLAMLQAKKEELEQAILEAESGAHSKIAARNQVVKKTKELLLRLATDINLQSNGDVTKALSSGFPQRATPTSAGILGAAGNARGKALGNGRIVINWNGLKGRHAYRVYASLEPNTQASWELRGEISKNRLVIEGLTPGVLYYFRVVGVNNFGEGAFSDIVAVRCV